MEMFLSSLHPAISVCSLLALLAAWTSLVKTASWNEFGTAGKVVVSRIILGRGDQAGLLMGTVTPEIDLPL